MSKTRILTGILTVSLVASMATVVAAQDEEVTPGEEPTQIELLEASGELTGEPVDVTDTDIAELELALEELRFSILGNTEYIDDLRTDLIRDSVEGNSEGIARLKKVIAGLNVDKLRDRVNVNQALLKEVTKRHLALAERVKADRALTRNLMDRLVQLETETFGQ